MTVNFTPEQESSDAEVAKQLRAVIREGVAQAESGDLVDDDEVHGWLESQELR